MPPSMKESILTPAEIEILNLVREGVTSGKGIAQAREVTTSTVANQFTSIYDKLGIPIETYDKSKGIIALIKAIQMGEIEPFRPSIDVDNSPIVKGYLLRSQGREPNLEKRG